MKRIPRGMTQYEINKNKIRFSNDGLTIGTGFNNDQSLQRIGAYNCSYLKECLSHIEDQKHEPEEVVIFVHKKRKELAIMQVGEFFIAPRIEPTDPKVTTEKRK